MSTWLSVAIRGLFHLEPDFQRRLWFVIDELPSLQRLSGLDSLLTEGRKYGACALLAMQSPAQLDVIYGRGISKVIVGNCLTRVAFTEQDPEVAEKISLSFGEQEVTEYQEGISYGAHEMRDGVSLSRQNKNKRVISVTDLLSLKKNQAFVKLPGNLPLTKTIFPIG